jgi:hypothetical protein
MRPMPRCCGYSSCAGRLSRTSVPAATHRSIRFRGADRRQIGVPVMILHGTADENVPVTEARRLYAAAHQPKTMIEVEGAGLLAAWEGGAKAPAPRRSPLGPRRARGPQWHGETAPARVHWDSGLALPARLCWPDEPIIVLITIRQNVAQAPVPDKLLLRDHQPVARPLITPPLLRQPRPHINRRRRPEILSADNNRYLPAIHVN